MLESRTILIQEGEDDEDITPMDIQEVPPLDIQTIQGPIIRARARQLNLEEHGGVEEQQGPPSHMEAQSNLTSSPPRSPGAV